MLKKRSKLILRAHKLLDICLTVAAFITAYFIKLRLLPAPFSGLSIDPNYYIVLLTIIIIWYMSFSMFDLYASYRKHNFARIFWNVIKAVSTGMLVLTLCMYVFKMTDVSRTMLGVFFLLNIGFLGLAKWVVYRMLQRYRKQGFNFRNILIIGSRQRAVDVIDAIGERLDAGYKVLGCLEVNQNDIGKKVKNGIRIIGTIDYLKKMLWERVVDELIFAMPLKKIENADEYIAIAEEIGVGVRIIPDWQIHKLMYKPKIASLRFEKFLGLSTLAITTTPTKHRDLLIKSAFDYLFAAVALVLSLPFFITISIVIKACSRGPVFYKDKRCGLNKRKFVLYKFRTMVADAAAKQHELETLNEADGPVFKIERDPRIIPFIGTFLRKTSLDELPQLINVIKGEMSLVGPRPPIPSEVEKYDIWQRRRLSMKPGMTCLWQVTPNRNQTTFEEWMKMDLGYIDNWSLGLDFKILLMTITAVLRGEGR